MSFIRPDDYSTQQLVDYWVSSFLVVVFIILLILFLLFIFKSYQIDEMRNIHNCVIYLSLLMDILLRIFCLLYSMIKDHNHFISDNTIQYYLNFQLPYDLINIAITA